MHELVHSCSPTLGLYSVGLEDAMLCGESCCACNAAEAVLARPTSAEPVTPEEMTVVVRGEDESGAVSSSGNMRPCLAVLGWEPLCLKQNSAMLRCRNVRSMAVTGGARPMSEKLVVT